MRISLKDLLAIVAFCAIVLWCASQLGFDNGIFWFGVGASLTMAPLFVALIHRRRPRLAILTAAFYLIIGLAVVPFGLICVLINALVLLVAGLFIARRPQYGKLRPLITFVSVSATVSILIGTFAERIAFAK